MNSFKVSSIYKFCEQSGRIEKGVFQFSIFDRADVPVVRTVIESFVRRIRTRYSSPWRDTLHVPFTLALGFQSLSLEVVYAMMTRWRFAKQ